MDDESSNNYGKEHALRLKKVEFSEMQPKINRIEMDDKPEKAGLEKSQSLAPNIHTDRDKLKRMNQIINDAYLQDEIPELSEQSLSLLKCRSDRKRNKKIMQEIEEEIYNTHYDELQRKREAEGWSENKRKLYENLDSLVDFHVEEVISHIFKETKELQEIFQNDERDNAEQVWKERFLEYTIKAIRLVKPSTRLMNDTMDINDYVEIELIEHEDDSKCKYING